MGLVDLRTDLKSLRFGKDRIGGGSSNQPYKTRPIPDSLSDTDVTGGPDFLLRGGTLALRNSVRDVSRLTQMLFDFKNPSGPLFTVKQNILSRTSVKTQASPNVLNDGIYLPTSTMAQAGVNALGIHLNKQGIDPTGIFGSSGLLGQPKYADAVKSNQSTLDNRLYQLYEGKIINDPTSTVLRDYEGGPGAKLGIGKTIINRTFHTTKGFESLTKTDNVATFNYKNIDLYYSIIDPNRTDKGKIQEDFRVTLNPPDKNASNLTRGLSYTRSNIEQRVNLGNPGAKGDKSNYQLGKNGTNTPLDKLTALPLYKSETPIANKIKNDLVKFRIGVIDNDNPSEKTYIHFRAFIDSLSDSYNSQWNGTQFVGRGEQLYRYSGFGRSVDLAWTVVAQSKDELIPMYQKLNYLASVCAPDYSGEGYMRGNLITLTLGGWFFEQVGFIEGITYTVPQESPWEIAVPSAETGRRTASGILTDESVKEMPHMIKVTGFKFTPIQSFLPSLQNNNFAESTFQSVNENYISSYGSERYIQLAKSKPGDPSTILDNYGNPTDGSRLEGNENYIPGANERVSSVNTLAPQNRTTVRTESRITTTLTPGTPEYEAAQ